MATTGIGVGIVGKGLIVLTALLERCTKRLIIHVCAKMIAACFILCAGEFLGHLSHSGDLLSWVGVRRVRRPLTSSSQKLLG